MGPWGSMDRKATAGQLAQAATALSPPMVCVCVFSYV
jgi:hypothetical protein